MKLIICILFCIVGNMLACLLAFTGCSSPITAYRAVLTGEVVVTDAETEAGVVLTAVISGFGGDGDVSFEWQRSKTRDGGYTVIENAAGETYTVTAEDAQRYIRVTVTRSGYDGSVSSEPTGPHKPPLTGEAGITGSETKVDAVLTADTSRLEEDGGVNYQWQRSETENGDYSDIEGANAASYTIAPGDVDKYIRLKLTCNGWAGWKFSLPVGPVTLPPLPPLPPLTGSVSIIVSGEAAKVDAVLSVNIDLLGEDGGVNYQWQRSETENGDYSDIEGANAASYTIAPGDVDSYIKVKVGREGYSGVVTSENPAGPVLASVISVTIDDVKIDLLSGERFISINPGETKILTATVVVNPDTPEYKGVTWSVYGYARPGLSMTPEGALTVAASYGSGSGRIPITAVSNVDETKSDIIYVDINVQPPSWPEF
jgi:hypothetical protein